MCMVRSLLVLSIYCAVFTICSFFGLFVAFGFCFFLILICTLYLCWFLCCSICFNSYGLLGIFVFCEHKAGPTHPPFHIILVSFFSVDHIKVSCDYRCRSGDEEEAGDGAVWQESCASSSDNVPNTSNKNRDEVSSQKRLLLRIKALLFVTLVVFIQISMLLFLF